MKKIFTTAAFASFVFSLFAATVMVHLPPKHSALVAPSSGKAAPSAGITYQSLFDALKDGVSVDDDASFEEVYEEYAEIVSWHTRSHRILQTRGQDIREVTDELVIIHKRLNTYLTYAKKEDCGYLSSDDEKTARNLFLEHYKNKEFTLGKNLFPATQESLDFIKKTWPPTYEKLIKKSFFKLRICPALLHLQKEIRTRLGV